MNSQEGLHHVHIRKRVHRNLEKYPHPKKFKRGLDRFIIFFAPVAPLMTVPQIFDIWKSGDASGVSSVSWSMYTINSIVWLLYGVAHKEKILIYTYILWIIANLTVVIGSLIY